MTNNNETNPFAVKYPHEIEAEEAVELFVPVFNDFPKVPLPENTFVIGTRGSGKSMMFRYMWPDCQLLLNSNKLKILKYYSIYIPLKHAQFNITELNGLNTHSKFLINEQLLTTFVAIRCIDSFINISSSIPVKITEQIKGFYQSEFQRKTKMAGWDNETISLQENASIREILKSMLFICEDMYNSTMRYCNENLNTIKIEEINSYSGPLASYLGFLHPILLGLKNIILNQNTPLYLLFDDADNLNKAQQRILNTWISYRFGPKISIKVSIEPHKYQTFRTLSGSTIDTPHDYSEVNINTVYTTSKKRYKENLRDIISKRLNKWKIDSDIDIFFPVYEKQEKRIQDIFNTYKVRYEQGIHSGTLPLDDAYRYSRPDYIREAFSDDLELINSIRAEYIKLLGGVSKQRSKYYYAGFEQLAHISSGIVRYFLDMASSMVTETQKIYGIKEVNNIPPHIQNDIARDYADKFLFDEFERLEREYKKEDKNTLVINKLNKMINSLGSIFFLILISGASERRVFSIALSTPPDDELKDVLSLGVQLGYFQESTIGNKMGTGRTRLYILNRRLAPAFTLDPTSFAGYKFISSEDLKLSFLDPDKFIKKIKDRLGKSPDEDIEVNTQLELF